MAEMPKYELTRPAHIAPAPGQRVQYCDAGRHILHDGVPGFHMKPLNDPARDAVKKAFGGKEQVDPAVVAIQEAATKKFDPKD
jgi:hypothetical protein